MSKKDKSKAKQGGDGVSAKFEGDTCWLYLPAETYEIYRKFYDNNEKRNEFWRCLFDLVKPEDTTVYGFEHINVYPVDNVSVKSADADDDDDDEDEPGLYPIKLCDEGDPDPPPTP